MTLAELLSVIIQHGSVRKAAIALGISPESISKRFRKLSDDDPIKQQYAATQGKKGKPRKYPDTIEGTRQRVRDAVKRYRNKDLTD